MICPKCNGRGAVQIAPNVKGLKRCPVCGGSGKITEYDGLRKFWCDYKCEVCNGTGEVEMTNEEWFCGLPTEEKARWIAEEKLCRGYFIFPSMEEAIQDAMEWLKQPHKE